MVVERYFKREWEEQYYIFDSKTISPVEVDEKIEYEGYRAFEDSMQGDTIIDRLNYLQQYKKEADILIQEGLTLAKENKELKAKISILKANYGNLQTQYSKLLNRIDLK